MLFIASFAMTAHNGEKNIELYKSGIVKAKIVKYDNYSQIIKYYENGSVEEIEFFDLDQKKIGHWVRYYDNGVIMGEGSFKRDKKHGDWKSYDVNGKLFMYVKYKKGKKDVLCMINENNELAVK